MNKEKGLCPSPHSSVEWIYTNPETNKKNVDECKLCRRFINDTGIRYFDGGFITKEGKTDRLTIERELYRYITPHYHSRLRTLIQNIMGIMPYEAYIDEPPLQTDRIHLKNGTYYIEDRRFSPEKDYCCNRLGINYNADAASPVRWKQFLNEMMDPEDQRTLQQYLGYTLIPSTKGQAMLTIIGEGGDGKSLIGKVVHEILGAVNVTYEPLTKIQNNRFAKSDLEGKLLDITDDLQMDQIRDTDILKELVTTMSSTDVERKYENSRQVKLYARFLCFGNTFLQSSCDESYGFWRRQLIIKCLKKPQDRVADRYLIDKLLAEKEGIFLWMLDGLHDLIESDMTFYRSDSMKEFMNGIKEPDGDLNAFLSDPQYVCHGDSLRVSGVDLYCAYVRWADGNLVEKKSKVSFIRELKRHSERFGFRYDGNVRNSDGKRVRGFAGIDTV